MVFKAGTSAFIIESNRLVKEVVIIKRTGNFHIVRFLESNGGIRVRESRLYATHEMAEQSVPGVRENEKRYLSSYEYLH